MIYEQYWDIHDKNKLSNSFSITQSIISLLVDSAIQDGYISSIDESVATYLDEFKINGKSNITIRHLLTMSSGLSWDENYDNPFSDNSKLYYDTNPKLWTLTTRVPENEPGTLFNYNSGDTQALLYVLQSATKQNISDYASAKLWSKIGTESDATWNLVNEVNSEEKYSCCFHATTRDFARLGKLINQNGRWDNEQLIDSSYVKVFKSLAPLLNKVDSPNQCYGFQHWIYTGLPYQVSYCRGTRGQYIISIPKFDLVIVRTGLKSGYLWEDSVSQTDSAMVDYRTDLPTYIEIALAILSQVN